MVTTARHTSSIYKCKYPRGIVKMQRTKDTVFFFFFTRVGQNKVLTKAKLNMTGEKKNAKRLLVTLGILQGRDMTLCTERQKPSGRETNKNNTADNDSKKPRNKDWGKIGESSQMRKLEPRTLVSPPRCTCHRQFLARDPTDKRPFGTQVECGTRATKK